MNISNPQRSIKITLVALDNFHPSFIMMPYDIFYTVGRFLNSLMDQKFPLFDIQLVTPNGNSVSGTGPFSFTPTCSITEVLSTDIIVIASIDGDIDTVLKNNKEVNPWLRHHHANGAYISGVSRAVIFLAETGLLNEKKAAVDSFYLKHFQQRFRKVNFIPDQLLVEEDRLISGSKPTSSLAIPRYLIEKFFGSEIATVVTNHFSLTFNNENSKSLSPKRHNDISILVAQQWIESNYASEFTVDSVCQVVNLGTRTFHRRFKEATGETPVHYLQRCRIEAAKNLLSTSNYSIEEISEQVGFESSNYFRMVFKKLTELSPKDYRKYSSMNKQKAVSNIQQ